MQASAPARLSEHLSVEEFLRTSHAEFEADQSLLWDGSPEIRANAIRLAHEVFEPVRRALRVPLVVGSGLRSPGLNAAVGGKPRSLHLFGLAIDVRPEGLDPFGAAAALAHALRRGELPDLDKAILEGREGHRWLHLQAAHEGHAARRVVLESETGVEFARLA